MRTTLPLPPSVEVGTRVHEAVDEDRKTWFQDVANQDELWAYVKDLSRLLDAAFRQVSGIGFTNSETNRYFHMSVANNRNGDPLKSIGSITAPIRES